MVYSAILCSRKSISAVDFLRARSSDELSCAGGRCLLRYPSIPGQALRLPLKIVGEHHSHCKQHFLHHCEFALDSG
jgi:hypothetical protein